MESGSQTYFGVVDFVVFGGSLIACALVGVYFAVKDRKKADTVNYYFGGKQMSPVAVGVSVAVSYISALTIIGAPTETYLYGTVAIWYPFVYIAGTVVAVTYYIPTLHRLQVKTLFELSYMCFALLVPALAISAVTPISLYWSIALTSAVCTVYTTVGGIKAVVWTDVVQFGFMFFGSTAALIMVTVEVGGVGNIWSALDRGGRLNFFEFNPDPTLRSTFWTIVVGGSITETLATCSKQTVFQRYLSCNTVADAQKAAAMSLLPKMIVSAISYVSGAAAYAYFEGCDPLASGAVTKSDQMFPYLVLKVFRNLPGMAGLFVAAAFSGSLSTVSSGLNSMSAQLLEDFLLPLRPDLSRFVKNAFSKLSAFGLGVVITGLAYLLLFLNGTVISMITTIQGGFVGAAIGVYTLALFFPWCNTKGVVAGEIMGFFVATWLGFGGIVYGKSPESQRELPVTTQCCNSTSAACAVGNFSSPDLTYITSAPANSSATQVEYSPLYSISMWCLSAVGLLVTLTVGLLVSLITGANDPTKSDPRLFCPLVDNRRLPEKVRRFFRFGVPDVEKKPITDKSGRNDSALEIDEGLMMDLKRSNDLSQESDTNTSTLLDRSNSTA